MKDLKRDQEMREKGIKLFRTFFFGEDMSSLERVIEGMYLRKKFQKYKIFLRSGVILVLNSRNLGMKWFGPKATKEGSRI